MSGKWMQLTRNISVNCTRKFQDRLTSQSLRPSHVFCVNFKRPFNNLNVLQQPNRFSFAQEDNPRRKYAASSSSFTNNKQEEQRYNNSNNDGQQHNKNNNQQQTKASNIFKYFALVVASNAFIIHKKHQTSSNQLNNDISDDLITILISACKFIPSCHASGEESKKKQFENWLKHVLMQITVDDFLEPIIQKSIDDFYNIIAIKYRMTYNVPTDEETTKEQSLNLIKTEIYNGVVNQSTFQTGNFSNSTFKWMMLPSQRNSKENRERDAFYIANCIIKNGYMTNLKFTKWRVRSMDTEARLKYVLNNKLIFQIFNAYLPISSEVPFRDRLLLDNLAVLPSSPVFKNEVYKDSTAVSEDFSFWYNFRNQMAHSTSLFRSNAEVYEVMVKLLKVITKQRKTDGSDKAIQRIAQIYRFELRQAPLGPHLDDDDDDYDDDDDDGFDMFAGAYYDDDGDDNGDDDGGDDGDGSGRNLQNEIDKEEAETWSENAFDT